MFKKTKKRALLFKIVYYYYIYDCNVKFKAWSALSDKSANLKLNVEQLNTPRFELYITIKICSHFLG